MGNFFSEMFKSLRATGATYKETHRAIREERHAQATEARFDKAFGVSFDELVRRSFMPRIEGLVLDVMERHLERLLPEALPQALRQLSHTDGVLGTGDDPGTLCACLSRETGAYWGEAPGGGDVSNNAFHASMAYDSEHDRYTITYKGGTVTSFGGGSTTFEGGERTSSGNPIYAYLFHTRPVAQGGIGSWIMEFGSAFPSASDGEVMVPLWHFDYARKGGGSLTQETEGAVVMPEIRNVVDVTDSSQGDQSE